jgi:Protein of unknown function (DUF2793)
MSDSVNLGVTYLEAAQAQKHVTVNAALSRLDGLIQLAVLSRVLAVPPVSPVDGDRYLVPAAATGVWAGQTGKIALRLEGAWVFATPREGWSMWVSSEDAMLSFDGTAWIAGGVPTTLQNMQMLGVNATADATNKFVVSSSATLFNHAGNGHQIKLNKNAAADTASLLWQTGFSGRAEIGTAGDDALHVKVSANGGGYTEMLVADATTGRLILPVGITLPVMATPVTPVNGQVWQDATLNRLRVQDRGKTFNLTGQTNFGVLAARHLINM